MSADPPRTLFQITREGGGTTVRFTAGTALTSTHVETLARRLPVLIADRGHTALTLDLTTVTALDSGALGKLIGFDRAVRAAEGHLTLLNPTPGVRRALRLTRLDTILDVRTELAPV